MAVMPLIVTTGGSKGDMTPLTGSQVKCSITSNKSTDFSGSEHCTQVHNSAQCNIGLVFLDILMRLHIKP